MKLRHDMLPAPNHDETARQAFVGTLRRTLATRVVPGNRTMYERVVDPQFRQQHGRAPQDRHEVRKAMLQNPYYQFWSALQRRSQEMIWDAALDPLDRQQLELAGRFVEFGANNPHRLGSLQLNAELPIPRYLTAADIHLQPGGYHTDRCVNDVTAGALYETGLQIYLAGALGEDNDGLGTLLLDHYRRTFSDQQPSRILEMGCAVGNSTLPWVNAFPNAEVHAIDVAAPCLRYGHARAEAMGAKVHFSQQNAEKTTFETGSFDLVISHIMLHETSARAMPRILAESRRLLKPGGQMLHLDIPRGGDYFQQFMYEWETYNNNENFAGYMTDVNLPEVACRAGFTADEIRLDQVAPPHSRDDQVSYSKRPIPFPVLVGQKANLSTQAA